LNDRKDTKSKDNRFNKHTEDIKNSIKKNANAATNLQLSLVDKIISTADINKKKQRYQDLSPSERTKQKSELLNKFKMNVLNLTNMDSDLMNKTYDRADHSKQKLIKMFRETMGNS
jgi:hypothetical protein